jgi:hypothetical protein
MQWVNFAALFVMILTFHCFILTEVLKQTWGLCVCVCVSAQARAVFFYHAILRYYGHYTNKYKIMMDLNIWLSLEQFNGAWPRNVLMFVRLVI